jgi:hypothetical protein
MTVRQFFDYLFSYSQTRELAVALSEIADNNRLAELRRSA